MMTLHILSGQARLVAAFNMPAAEKALGIPTFMRDARNDEEVIGVKSRRMARKLLAARGIDRFDFVAFKTLVV